MPPQVVNCWQPVSSFNTPVLSASASYYVGLNDRNGTLMHQVRPLAAAFLPSPGEPDAFDAEVPFVLEKATINVTGTGTMTVIIVDKDSSNSIIASRVRTGDCRSKRVRH